MLAELDLETLFGLVGLVAYGVYEFLRRTPWVLRSFDRGGLRLRNLLTGRRRYVPFSTIAALDVEGGKVLVLRDRRRAVLARVFHGSPEACGKTLVDLPRLAARPLGACSVLARGGVDLEAWLERVRGLATRRGPFRGTALEPEQAIAVARDEQAPLGERAAALYFLCCAGQPSSELLAGLDQSSPPLLVVVAALAPGGEALVPLAEDLVRYLPPEDQAAFHRARDAARNHLRGHTTARNPRAA